MVFGLECKFHLVAVIATFISLDLDFAYIVICKGADLFLIDGETRQTLPILRVKGVNFQGRRALVGFD